MLASSGVSPTLTKNIPNFARSDATITSNGRIIVIPMPTAAPLTAAISGLDERMRPTQSTSAGIPPEPSAVLLPGSTPSRRLPNVACMSAPAQNPRPAPVMTIAPTSSSSLAAVMAAAWSEAICGVHAFIRSGRLSVIRATRPWVAYSIVS